MFDLFKKQAAPAQPDVKGIRDGLLQFIKSTLAKWEGGEGGALKKLHLFLAPSNEEKPLYEAAVYTGEESRFKEAVQKIADDYALDLPPRWALETTFTNELPAEATKAPQLPAALFIQTKEKALPKTATAYIKVLQGEAEQELYTITSESGKITIGRGKKVQTHNAFFRINTIAFPEESAAESNKYISRQHAHIEWDNAGGTFLLFADEGGVPPRNKIKVRSVAGGDGIKLQSTKTGYSLQEGDQIVLGETALLEFRYSPD
jgi:hypothetical protein